MDKRKKKCTGCGKREAKPHTDNGLDCGDDLCDICFEKMVNDCRKKVGEKGGNKLINK